MPSEPREEPRKKSENHRLPSSSLESTVIRGITSLNLVSAHGGEIRREKEDERLAGGDAGEGLLDLSMGRAEEGNFFS